tara:strand:+ start:392 stop:4000 length:3609 start_codon:yes stop_codon:yes gene_type:complete
MLFDRRLMKAKAMFQILVVMFALFSVSLFNVRVVEAQQNVCCSETIDGEHCLYTDESNCAPGSLKAAASCEQTSFCKLGCGFDQNDGICFNNMPKFSCEEKEGCSWSPEPECNIPQCQKGCCVLSNQCSFTTQLQCKTVTSQFEDINMTFMEEIGSELECINQCRSFERGACVSPDASCEFTTREACNEVVSGALNATLPLVGFHPDRLCSNPALGTECAAQQYTGCLPDADGVYWFDSCGNPENIYSSDKTSSYNSGFVLDKSESCNPSQNNAGSETCGNCNYALGSICDVAEVGVSPVFGDYACKDLVCGSDVVNVDENAPATANLPLDNGESWCAYDGLVGVSDVAGLGLDLVGSRHYRRICINGIELTEACKDFREEICVQGSVDSGVNPAVQNILETQESFGLVGAGSEIIAAACRDNRFSDCSLVDTKEDCENIAQRDCLWILGDNVEKAPDNFDGVACVPLVPPGLKHWSGESAAASSGVDPKAACEKGDKECTVYFHKGGVSGIFGGDWECVGNCECLGQNYLENANAVCKSLGDCGAWYNFAGESTCSGFVDNLDSSIKTVGSDVEVCDTLPPFGNLAGAGIGGAPDTGFKAFWNEAAIPVAYLTVGALVTGGGAGFAGFKSAFTGLGSGIFEPIKNTLGKFFGATPTPQPLTPLTAKPPVFGPPAPTPLTPSAKAAAPASPLNTLMWAYLIYQVIDVLFADDMEQIVSVECNPWQAPVGGDDCELCQEDGKECSEYRCMSLGQSCKLVNVGSENEKCIDANVNDVTAPFLSVNKDLTLHLTDSIDSENDIVEVTGKGFEIVQEIEPFTAVSLAVDTNEFSQCKYDVNNGVPFDQMVQYFGDSDFDKTHTVTFSLPGALAEEEILQLTNGGEFQIFVKCQDGNGNQNEADYYAKFKIQPGPDFTAPVIELTGLANGAYVPNGVNQTDLTIYTNEPANCNWDDIDVEFDDMSNSFICNQNPLPTSSLFYGLYDCSTTLTGIEDSKVNSYYFKCEDQPTKPKEERNVNIESFLFQLIGTIPLDITSVFPDDNVELSDNSPVLKVITSGGAFGNGVSVCGYSFDDSSLFSSIEFLNTNSSVHEQPFFNLTSGPYTAFVNCADVAGNLAADTAEFTIIVDTFPPQLLQAYTEPGILNIVMDEKSICEYSVDGGFAYGSGIPMTGINTEKHTASLESDVFFIMCTDNFNNIGSYTLYL